MKKSYEVWAAAHVCFGIYEAETPDEAIELAKRDACAEQVVDLENVEDYEAQVA